MDKQRRGVPWIGWWYVAIATGFALLAIDHLVMRDRPWLIGVRVVIAAGFAFLAWNEFRTGGRKK